MYIMFLHLTSHLMVKQLTVFNVFMRLNVAFCAFVLSATIFIPMRSFQFCVKCD